MERGLGGVSANLWLVANAASGSNSDESLRAVHAALVDAGAAPARVIVNPALWPGRAALEQAGVTELAVFGGDGTVGSVATRLEGWGGTLLVLPGGTANLLARALHGERDAPAIAANFQRLDRARRPCIRSQRPGGEQLVALVEVLAGPGATWSDVREGLREGAVSEVAGAAVAAIRQSTTGPMVALVDPPLGRADGYSGIRLEVATGGLTVEGYGAETVGDYLKQGIALLRRNFREGPHDELGRHRAVLCRSLEDAPIPLMVDGERREGGAEQRFSLAEFALDLFVTR